MKAQVAAKMLNGFEAPCAEVGIMPLLNAGCQLYHLPHAASLLYDREQIAMSALRCP